MSNATKTAKRSDFKKYFQFMWRSLNIQASWNYERQMNMGFLYGIAPTLDELYPNENDPEQLAHKKEAYEREMAFYNCTPQTSAFTLGLAASMEEQYAADRENFNPETINAVKTSLMGPLSGVGDSFFQGTVRLIAFGLGISIVADIVAKHNVENVAFVGCGASKAELYPAKYFLANCSKKLRVAHYTANEFNYDTPDWLGDTTVVITASLGGSTPETVKANSVAKAAGATVVSVTHAAGSALTKEADYTIVHGFEANYAAKLEKMGYVLALAVEILQQVEGFDKYDKMIEGLTNVFEAAENAANSARKSAKEFAEKYKDAPVVYVMSSGASMEVAYSTSICLMMEMQWVNSGSFHSGEFFHGPFEIVDKDVPFILLMNDGKTRPVDARALTFLHRFDALTTVVDAKDYGLGNAVDSSVITYFNPLMHTAVFRVYAEELSYVRQHPLTLRRYMWKLEY